MQISQAIGNLYFMSKQEKLPQLGGDRLLTEIELQRFAENVIWPAVDVSYEDDFRQTADVEDWHIDRRSFESPDGASQLKLELRAAIMQDKPESEVAIAQFDILVYYDEFTKKLAKRGEDGTVWVVNSYIFQDDEDPYLIRYLQLRDEFDEEVDEDEMSQYARDLLFTTGAIEHESDNLTHTDCLEIYNGLLALGMSESMMRYRDWEYGIA